MGYRTRMQVIERKNGTRQFYVICPAPLAEAMELVKGEEMEWVVEGKTRLMLQRIGGGRAKG